MRNRIPKRLANNGMTLERYMSLKWMCRESDKMRAALADLRDPLRATAYGESTGGRTGPGDPTGKTVERIISTPEFRRVNAITQAAIATDAMLYQAIIENVCRGKAYGQIHPRPICGERQFYGKCIDFFAELDVLL